MYEINMEKFGRFVSARRKALGMTQRELAEKLCLSDKAVSKWERGLSLPDVSVLMPLAEALGVSVTELLEGEQLDAQPIPAARVEEVVQKAIGLSDSYSIASYGKRFQKKNLPVFLGMCAVCVAEFFAALSLVAAARLFTSLLTLDILSILFGAYFWLFAATRLPSYYDEHRINLYADGIFRMHIPGIAFNNRNWGHILRACRLWSLLAAIIPTPLFLLLNLLFGDLPLLCDMILLFLFLGGLFVPIYYVAWKYR